MKDLSTKKHFVGCDVSKDTLDFALFERGKDYRLFEHIQVPNNTEGFQAMRKWLRSLKVKLSESAVAMEHTGSYSTALAEWCHKKGYTFVFLHPLDVKNAGARGRNKTDKIDAQFIADYLYTMREKLEPSTPESPIIKKLRMLRNERRLAVYARAAFATQSKCLDDTDSAKRTSKIISELNKQISAIEAQILDVIRSDESIRRNYGLLLTLKGVGMVNALTTIIATGNFTRFQTARQYAKFCCVSRELL
jgi:transposase